MRERGSMNVREVRATRDTGGHWQLEVIDGPVEGIAIVVTDVTAGTLVWHAVSDAFSEPTYYTASVQLGEAQPVDIESVSESELIADLVAQGVDPAVAADRTGARSVVSMRLGVAPHGFRTEPCEGPPVVVPGHQYSIMVVGNWAFPTALGTFNG